MIKLLFYNHENLYFSTVILELYIQWYDTCNKGRVLTHLKVTFTEQRTFYLTSTGAKVLPSNCLGNAVPRQLLFYLSCLPYVHSPSCLTRYLVTILLTQLLRIQKYFDSFQKLLTGLVWIFATCYLYSLYITYWIKI